MKFFSLLFALLRKPRRIASVPGETATVRFGRFRLPLLDPTTAITKLQQIKEGKLRGVGFTIQRGGATQQLQVNVGD